MITDKEYPATHSMSTAWYMVDDEGNVGIMDYNENGPVPWGLEESDTMELVFSHKEHDDDEVETMFYLTEEQVMDILSSTTKPNELDWWCNILIKIDLSKKERFEELYNRRDKECTNTYCLSETLGIYRIDADAFMKHNEHSEENDLDLMIKERIILEAYLPNEYYMNDEYDDDDNIYYTKSFENAPFFIYCQPYWTGTCQERMNIPRNPVHISQCPEDLRHRIHRVKGLFREMTHIQIAQFHPCDTNSEATNRLGSCDYALFPLPNGSQIYCLTDMTMYDFLPFCPLREENGCNSCESKCIKPEACSFTNEPTVLIVLDPRESPCYDWKYSNDMIFKRSICLPYIGRCPEKHGKESYNYRCQMSPSELTKLLSETKGYFESIVNDLKPRVIILMQMASTIMNNVFSIDNHSITIDGKDYPIYKYDEIKEYHEEIQNLASLPYQGNEHRLTYTQEEMTELEKQGIAKCPRYYQLI